MANILITGANGFIGKNLYVALKETSHSVNTYSHNEEISELKNKVIAADFIFHLAGVNRPDSREEFFSGNTDFTQKLLTLISLYNPKASLIYSSSTQAEKDNPYGESKNNAEKLILQYVDESNIDAYIYRLPGVFGKWCRPNYNSVVATFCYNTVHDIPLRIDNPDYIITLAYIDDVIEQFVAHLSSDCSIKGVFCDVTDCYDISLGELASKVKSFKESRTSLITNNVGKNFTRALYATYLSYLPPEQFSYSIPVYEDNRGIFSEVLKTPEYGQFSFFTAKPGIVRGGHYHHTKNEKFIVVSGKALFKFENIVTGEIVEFEASSNEIKVVDTIPGWAHNIKNIGSEDLIVMLWANEIFDHAKPDTIPWSM